MLTEILKPLLVTLLVWFSIIDCAYLVLGPLEVTSDSIRNDGYEIVHDQAKALPKREFKVSREKQKSKSVTSKIEDDVEIIEQIPYCTNIYKSSICTKEKKNAKVEKLKNDDTKCNEKAKEKSVYNNVNQKDKLTKLSENVSIIEKLKRELAKEREKVRNLTKELSAVKKMCDYTYEDEDPEFSPSENNNIQTIKSSLDLYNLINTKKDDNKIIDSSKNSRASEDDNNSNAFSKSKIKDELNSQVLINEDRINKDLFKDNVYQIPNFSVNDQKNYKNPIYSSDVSVFNQNSMGYGNIPLPKSSVVFPYKENNVHEDILKTLYPQFFLADPTETIDRYSHSKRGSGRSLVEPRQIYDNNMKQLTAPYKIFPGRINSDYRFYNIRDKRGNLTQDLDKNKCKLIQYNTFSENDLSFDVSPDSDIVIKFNTSRKRDKKKAESGFINNSFQTNNDSDDVESGFKSKNPDLKLEGSSDGDESQKENYFESSKESEAPKNEEIYNKLLKKYLKRIKAYKNDEMSNDKEFVIENNGPEGKPVTEEVETEKEKDLDNGDRQNEITSAEVRKAANKSPPVDPLFLKKLQEINGSISLEEQVKVNRKPLINNLRRENSIKNVKENENQPLKGASNNDDTETLKENVESQNIKFVESNQDSNDLDYDKDETITEDDESKPSEEETHNNNNNKTSQDNDESNDNSDGDLPDITKEDSITLKTKRNRMDRNHLANSKDTFHTSSKNAKKSKIFKSKKSGRHLKIKDASNKISNK